MIPNQTSPCELTAPPMRAYSIDQRAELRTALDEIGIARTRRVAGIVNRGWANEIDSVPSTVRSLRAMLDRRLGPKAPYFLLAVVMDTTSRPGETRFDWTTRSRAAGVLTVDSTGLLLADHGLDLLGAAEMRTANDWIKRAERVQPLSSSIWVSGSKHRFVLIGARTLICRLRADAPVNIRFDIVGHSLEPITVASVLAVLEERDKLWSLQDSERYLGSWTDSPERDSIRVELAKLRRHIVGLRQIRND